MAATKKPDIREGAATMTRGFRVHKKTRWRPQWHLTSERAQPQWHVALENTKKKMAPDIRVRKKRWQQIWHVASELAASMTRGFITDKAKTKWRSPHLVIIVKWTNNKLGIRSAHLTTFFLYSMNTSCMFLDMFYVQLPSCLLIVENPWNRL